MRRRRSGEEQLDLEWMHTMGWADVPIEIRDRVREHLSDLLQRAAVAMAPADGASDE